ncbi:thioesterase II family protein [Streptomyces sp. NBC_00503]|uniref:thioesterase II family protein n=1 Tax=Streptomyces sp. NBC_00503 TaxID=2903659 RepID=UPI002E808A0D|nr:thioesterase domain-containing protein [Streptomyces sp. NBC_00503]WUD82802.1 thioesterase domain-containing protein [Streptomyces sp. NBC_00503]
MITQEPQKRQRPRTEGDWLFVPAPQPHRPYRLFCFPHAGGDAPAYTRLAHSLAPFAEVWALRMPARGGRRRDPMPASFDLLVATVAEELRPHLGGDFGFYGQSFGALLAYEVARALPKELRPGLVVAASAQPPSAWTGELPQGLGAADLLHLTGMGELVDADPELRDMALAAVQSDLDVKRTYRHRPSPLLDSDLYAVAGDGDPMLDAQRIAGWAEHTSGGFGLSVVPGGHLLAAVDRRGPVELLTSVIGSRSAAPAAESPVENPSHQPVREHQ